MGYTVSQHRKVWLVEFENLAHCPRSLLQRRHVAREFANVLLLMPGVGQDAEDGAQARRCSGRGGAADARCLLVRAPHHGGEVDPQLQGSYAMRTARRQVPSVNAFAVGQSLTRACRRPEFPSLRRPSRGLQDTAVLCSNAKP